jgi:hypothetical protein
MIGDKRIQRTARTGGRPPIQHELVVAAKSYTSAADAVSYHLGDSLAGT